MTNSFVIGGMHHSYPWYIGLPLLVLAIAATIWRWRRGGGGRGPFGGGRSGPFG